MEYIITEKMRVGYGDKAVVEDINISLKHGEIMTLIGPNGVGKSTILKSFIKQLSILGGTLVLDQQNIEDYNERMLAKKMAIVMTGRMQGEYFTCEEVVEAGRYPYTGRFGILSEEDHKIVDEALELVNMKAYAKQAFDELSDGQKQRILLAKAICQEPEILVLDEPASYLDIRYKLELAQTLKMLASKKNIAILMALHEIDLAQRISDVVVCIKDGKIDRFGAPEDIYTSEYIADLYDIKQGSYHVSGGLMELPAVLGAPKVFVIGGGGAGTSVYHALWKKQIPFAVGVLHANDVELPVAKALAVEVVEAKPFEPISDEMYEQAKALIDTCEAVVCACECFGTMNQKNKLLLEYAKEQDLITDINKL